VRRCGIGLADVALWAGAGALCGPLIVGVPGCPAPPRQVVSVVLGGALSGALSAFVPYASATPRRPAVEPQRADIHRSPTGLRRVARTVQTLPGAPDVPRVGRARTSAGRLDGWCRVRRRWPSMSRRPRGPLGPRRAAPVPQQPDLGVRRWCGGSGPHPRRDEPQDPVDPSQSCRGWPWSSW